MLLLPQSTRIQLGPTSIVSELRMTDPNQNGRSRIRVLRKKLLSWMPVIRRTRHHRAVARLKRHIDRLQGHVNEQRALTEGLGSLFLSPPSLATSAAFVTPVAFQSGAVDELCLFVTHSPQAVLKCHVIDHVAALLDAGIAVILIVNSDVELTTVQIPADLAARLHGCIVRQNVGFDFAAWAHAYAMLKPGAALRRLYLVNDSLVGPLERGAYNALLTRIRSSDSDVVGLTSNPDPHPHLQSFFLVFNERLLRSDVCSNFFRSIVNLPIKQNVIDCYEIWLTPFLVRNGFRSEAIFPNFSKLPAPRRNDTVYAWRELIMAGFPFIKSVMLRDPIEGKASREMLPARYR